MMSYKILLNILILFLCTSCCAYHDECSDSIDAFYIRPIDKATGENAILKYEINDINDSPFDTLTGKAYLTDNFDNRVNATVYQTTWYGSEPYLVIGIDDNYNSYPSTDRANARNKNSLILSNLEIVFLYF